MSALQGRAEATRDKALVRPGFRERVEQLMRAQWHEPVIVLRLGDDDLGFDVPGRRQDGTVKEKRLVRRFFWNTLRGIGAAALYVLSLAHGGGELGNPFRRAVRFTGPANAMALDLADKLLPAKGPWLVFSPTRIALVDTGPTFHDPADAPPPLVVWQGHGPHAPQVNFRQRTLTWPDGSAFSFPLHSRTEDQHLRKHLEFPDTIRWSGPTQ
ncbi:hypothetical protein [Amycolatopsis sp. NPDC059657]|uniref:hypothetical protein n=1 Tax=Amycolatopsis sp. NPDC059657 TaxID=3346899 RepID=UPI00366F162D